MPMEGMVEAVIWYQYRILPGIEKVKRSMLPLKKRQAGQREK
jgi:hypothetical protein